MANGERTCEHTADHVPAIQEEDTGPNVSPALKNAETSDVVAATRAVKFPVPKDISAISMVLVHRKQDGSSCLGIGLNSPTIPDKTKVNRLRFGKGDERFLGAGTVINWIE
jgi:hypothetical protein